MISRGWDPWIPFLPRLCAFASSRFEDVFFSVAPCSPWLTAFDFQQPPVNVADLPPPRIPRMNLYRPLPGHPSQLRPQLPVPRQPPDGRCQVRRVPELGVERSVPQDLPV